MLVPDPPEQPFRFVEILSESSGSLRSREPVPQGDVNPELYLLPELTGKVPYPLREIKAVNAPLLNHEDRVHRAVERLKHAHDFSAKELKWLDRIEKYLIKESVLTPQTFDESPLFRDKGGFGAFDKVFGNRLAGLVAELNGYLYDEGSMAA